MAPIPVHEQRPAPTHIPHTPVVPQVLFEGEFEHHHASSHSRAASNAVSFVESPPITPRNFTFGNHINPSSPPGSVVSFGSGIDLPSSAPSGLTSRATSVGDFSRMSSYYGGSRPSTAELGPGPANRSSSRLRETFTSPPMRSLTMHSKAPSFKVERERPKSTMLTATGALHKPWVGTRDPYSRVAYILTYGVMFLGIAAGAVRTYFAWRDVPLINSNLCLVMDENFDSENIFGDNGTFVREVDMSGFGNGEFEMTTASQNNSFVKDGYLYLVPTLTSDNLGIAAIEDGHVYNITGCTFNDTRGSAYAGIQPNTPVNAGGIGSFDADSYYKACSAVSNSTSGQIINPVQSARLSTRRSANIKYGRVEVRAKIPTGCLWPAIWMLPVDNMYGPWPMSGTSSLFPRIFKCSAFIITTNFMSGEIDIMEARGNGPRYARQGSDWVRGSLNWGPLTWINAVSKTFGSWHLRRGSYASDFHTYVLEWTEDFIRISVDTRLHYMLMLKIDRSFWNFGNFPPVVQNGSEAVVLTNPWVNGTKAAPFDQRFYLILDVAVGGTNGWFPDGVDNKPWLDGSRTAMGDFWRNRAQWLPTWPHNVNDRAMVVDYVKMWQTC
ncbi:concanavalin A-like lectin/glucanase [Tricholoma matsutake]|nr:concanavalin A-like lectin/glucanase [Tricholoma matsutake 945]